MKTNHLLNDLNALAGFSASVAKINLTQSANIDGIKISDMSEMLGKVLTNVMQSKDLVLDDTRHSDTPLFKRFEKCVSRHNEQVLFDAIRSQFDTTGEAVNVLAHITYKQGEGYKFSATKRKVSVTAYTVFNVASDSRLVMSAKHDKKENVVTVTLTPQAIPVELLIAQYAEWKNSLVDFVAVQLNDNASTIPDVTIETVNDESLLKAINTLQSQHQIDLYQIQSTQAENMAMTQQIADLRKQVAYWQDLANIRSGLLATPVKSKRRA